MTTTEKGVLLKGHVLDEMKWDELLTKSHQI